MHTFTTHSQKEMESNKFIKQKSLLSKRFFIRPTFEIYIQTLTPHKRTAHPLPKM